jgi:PAS domain S-box-containing protein
VNDLNTEFQKEITRINNRRVGALSVITLGMGLYYVAVHLLARPDAHTAPIDGLYFYLDVAMAALSAVMLTTALVSRRSGRMGAGHRLTLYTGFALVLIWCGAISVLDRLDGNGITTLSIGAFFVAVAFHIPWRATVVVFGAGLVSYYAFGQAFGLNPLGELERNITPIMVVVLAAAASHMLYRAKYRSFFNHWQLLRIRDELEARVRERSQHLMTANQRLRLEMAEREAMEKALRESEEKYRVLAETAPELICIHDMAGRFLYANQAALDFAGLTEKEITSKWVWDWLPPEEANTTDQRRRARVAGDASRQLYEIRLMDGRGRRVPFEISSSPITRDGRTTDILIVARDLTERFRSEEMLREMTGIVNQSPAVAFLWRNEPGWPVEFVSENVSELLGYSAEDFLSGRVVYADAVHPEDMERVSTEVAAHAADPHASSFIHQPYRVVTRDGRVKWIDDRTRIRRDDRNQATHFQGVILDITSTVEAQADKERLEAQLRQAQKMEAIGTLAGGIAHDFNNLLQAINGYTEILLLDRGPDDPGFVELEQISQAGRRAAKLVRELLTFSRKVEARRRPVDLNHEIRQARVILERTIPRMIEIEVREADGLWTVEADPTQMEQILLNLGANAADAMPEGGRLSLETRNVRLEEADCRDRVDAAPGDYVRLTVTDTGQGVPPDVLPHIFEPFFTTKEVGKGTGLGLASVYGIAKSHGGHIECDSVPGRGTAFHIYLPAQAPREIESGDAEARGAAGGGRAERVLVVDDEASLRELTGRVLERHGYQVTLAASGEDALAVQNRMGGDLDLVVLDLGMPGMGGYRCLEELKRADPGLKVIVLSGYAPDQRVRTALAGAPSVFMSKPYKIDDLLVVVRDVLDAAD